MRTRRKDRIGPAQADHLIAGDQPHPRHRGLGDLLDAAKAPGTPRELAGEQAAVAAFSAAYTRAAAPKGKDRARVRKSARRVVVTATTSLALLALTGTAVTARAGSLPDPAQQHAHRLFSALGVPAPRTGPANPVTRPTPSTRPSAPATPSAASSAPVIVPLDWCETWQATPTALDPETRRRLTEAAGGAKKIEKYCAKLSASPTPPKSGPPSAPQPPVPSSPSAPSTPSTSASPSAPATPSTTTPGTKSPGRSGNHPTPPVPTPAHPGKK